MQVMFLGVRGSYPVAEAGYLRYGGETTSLLVRGARDEWLAIDAGTGIRRLGRCIRRGAGGVRVTFLLTHYHLDHTAGLGACPLLYDPRASLEVAGVRQAGRSVRQAVESLFRAPFWPVATDRAPARVRFRDLRAADPAPLRRGGLAIRWATVHHAGGCTAYRIDEPATGAAFVFATDIEWPASSPSERRRLIRLCREPAPAGLLIFDGQFTPREYPKFRGWGHSSWSDALEVARASGTPRVCITHHDPDKDDRRLAQIERNLRSRWRRASLAREGMKIVPAAVAAPGTTP